MAQEQYFFDFSQEDSSKNQDIQAMVDGHNRQFIKPIKSKWGPDKTLDLLNAVDARAHAVLTLRTLLSFQLKAALNASSAQRQFLKTLMSEVQLKNSSVDPAQIVRNVVMDGKRAKG